MKNIDSETLTEWLDRELDGDLDGAARATLAERLAQDPALAAERARFAALHQGLAQSRVAVREGFREQVMASLPAAAWEPRRAPAWVLPLAMAAGLAVAAGLLLGGGTAGSPVVGTGAAIADFLATALLTGAGLVAASWRGAGLALEEFIAQSGFSLAAMAVLVVCLNLLFFSLLRRRPATETIVETTGGTSSQNNS